MADDTPPNPDDGTSKRGRKTKLTTEIASAVFRAILEGNHRYVAGKAYGISQRTFQTYMKNGRRYPEGIYGVFRRGVLLAEAEWEKSAVAKINTEGREDDARFLCWLLERRQPQRWGKYRGDLGAMMKIIRQQTEQIADLERELRELTSERSDSITS